MNIPFRVKLLTDTAKAPERANQGDLWDLFADDFLSPEDLGINKGYEKTYSVTIPSGNRVLVKTGISLELPKLYQIFAPASVSDKYEQWYHEEPKTNLDEISFILKAYAVADIRSRSGLAIKHGIEVLNSPATIDNSYRKEIGVIIHNTGRESYTITKGDKIAQMLIRPLYPSKMEIVDHIEDTGRGGYGSTGK